MNNFIHVFIPFIQRTLILHATKIPAARPGKGSVIAFFVPVLERNHNPRPGSKSALSDRTKSVKPKKPQGVLGFPGA